MVLLIGCLLPFFLLYLVLAMAGLAWTPYTCRTEVTKTIANLSGLDFEISDTGCDLLAKDWTTSVFVTPTGKGGKTLLFKYAGSSYPLPEIRVIEPDQIFILENPASGVIVQKRTWATFSVNYGVESYFASPPDMRSPK